ncbi:MAG: PIN domain-containing protein [Rhodocyclaceae bacterium]|nr:PIN domain-containing protein [Rhodocyclaceae bacterium]MBX3667875.1 PIN domain-containing protein [Rhodocyclaceae bacterium]
MLVPLFDLRVKGELRLRLDGLVAELKKTRTKILIPTPALTEFMAKADKARDEYHQRLTQSAHFKIEPFGLRAAMECALLLGEKSHGTKRNEGATWAKVKFDWQIAATAKVAGARTIYSDDADLVRLARRLNLQAFRLNDLPLPDAARQTDWVRDNTPPQDEG